MNDHEIDTLVRDHLRREADRLDAGPLVARVLAVTHGGGNPKSEIRNPEKTRFGFRASHWSLTFATAAAVLLAILGGISTPPASARAAALVAAAHEEHGRSIDRCYRVTVTPAPGSLLERLPPRLAPREVRLWTRGDRFWCTSPIEGGPLSWGRDGQGRLWVALTRQRGLVLGRDDIPEQLALACDVRSVQLETLLRDVLADFELRAETPAADTPAGCERLRAVSTRHPTLRSAVLEIDPRTKEVQRLILHRALNGRPLAVVTLTLTETGARPAAEYELENHLDKRN